MMKTHALKTWPIYFEAMWVGDKMFELRRQDREFREQDRLLLQEYDPVKKAYTGRELLVRVTCLVDSVPEWGLMEDFCIMGVMPLQWISGNDERQE